MGGLFLVGAGVRAGGSLCQTGTQYFDYGPHRANAEAEQLAMHLSAQLRAPDEEYERVRRDLALIRTAYPVLGAAVDDPDYVRDQLIVNVASASPQYEQANVFYQVVNDEIPGGSHVLTFCDNLNAPQLAVIYEALPGVNYAEPNFFIGTDDQITIAPLGTTLRYDIDDGFNDCPAGCICHRLWSVDVDEGGGVLLVSFDESCGPSHTACCAAFGTCEVRAIGACLGDDGLPLDFFTSCEGDADQDGRDAACGDNCFFVANPSQTNVDGDAFGAACDCNDSDASSFPGATEINDGVDQNCDGLIDEISGTSAFSGDKETFSWDAQSGAIRYSVARGDQPDFSGVCETFGTFNAFYVDTTTPTPGMTFHYLARAFGPGSIGSWGADSNGQERMIPCAP